MITKTDIERVLGGYLESERDEIALRFAVVLVQESAKAEKGLVRAEPVMSGAYSLADYFLAERARQRVAKK